MNVAEIRELIGADRYDEGRRLAWRTARGCGSLSRGPTLETDDEGPYAVVADVLSVALAPDDSVAVTINKVCRLYREFPSYTLLFQSFLELGYVPRPELVEYYRFAAEMLSAEEAELADPIAYHLWSDMFERPELVEEAWSAVMSGIQSTEGWRRLLENSGPVPVRRKAPVFKSLSREAGLHGAIINGLYLGLIDVYGSMDRATIQTVLPLIEAKTEEETQRAGLLLKRLSDERVIAGGVADRSIIASLLDGRS